MTDWSIRREVFIAAPTKVVWRCIAEPERISRWWCPPPTVELSFEPREGSSFAERYDDGERAYHLRGTVAAHVPGQRLAFRRETGRSASSADLIDITLHSQDGGTRVVIDHSFEDLPAEDRPDMEALYADGWSAALRLLRDLALGIGS